MTREFLSAPINYKPEAPPETPYLKARDEWDNRIGSSVARAKNWRLACLAATAASFVLSITVLIQTKQQRVIPVVVGVDRERGEPVVISPVSQTIYQPQLQEIKYFLSHFVTLVRSVPSDPVLIKQNWLKAYAFLRSDAANLLNDITNSDPNSPVKKIGQQTVLIQPLTVTQVAGSESFQARWEETIYNDHGKPVEKYVMNGIFTIELDTPVDEAALYQNPLGIFIKSFQWNKEL
ncbi:MAG: conjugal transfer protein TrbF [Proteobacteria bacterium]|nr:MAG: conjugal transfer protein TrbF [Pseudomonadota bacterium]